MSSNAGVTPGHAITTQSTPAAPPPPFTPGTPLFNVVNTAVPYQAIAGDLVVTTDTTVTTPIAPVAGTYFAVKNAGVLTVTVVGTVDGVANYVIPPTAAGQEAVWFVWNAVLATWEIVSDYDPLQLFNIVQTAAVGYQALVKDLVLTTSSSVITPIAPTNGSYFAVKNVGALTVTITGTVDGAAGFTIPPSATPASMESVWFVWNAAGATWQAVAGFNRNLPLSVDTVAGAAYNFALTDANVRLKSFTNAGVKTATVLDQATVGWRVGTILRGLNFGTAGVAGALTVVQGAGVTIQTPETLVVTKRYAQFQLTYLGGDVWVLSGALDIASFYEWTWANAAARLAQAVTASQFGAIGYQQDMQLQFRLVQVSPVRWGEMADPQLSLVHSWRAVLGQVPTQTQGFVVTATSVAAPRGATGTTKSSLMARTGVQTTAVAGNFAISRCQTNPEAWQFGQGIRARFRTVLGPVTANMRWFMGFSATVPAANVNPNTFVSCFGIGIGDEASGNIQLYHNDAAGAPTQTDLGASYPARTTLLGYGFQLFTLDGLTYAWQVRTLNSPEVSVSGIASVNVPAATGIISPFMWYVTNNTDAAAAAIDFAGFDMAAVAS
jgi:hypothetical protein